MGRYYYLIAGLTDICLDDSKAPVSVESLRAELYEALDASDRKVMDMLSLEDECRNLIGSERMQELIAQVKAEELSKDVPQFLYTFVQEWLDESWKEKSAHAQDRLWSLFYEYAMSHGNAFVRKWYEFNLDLNNVLAAITARKYNLDIQKVVVGENATAQALRTSGARDWGLSQELECFDDVMRLFDETDLSQRERKIDLIRWRWLEENTFFEYFTVERLFSYMVRLGMVERWCSLDKAEGQKLFRKLIGDLKEQTEVPEEFKTN